MKEYGTFPSNEFGCFSWCPECGYELHNADANYCVICGHPIINICSDPECNHQNTPYARFCEKCGKPTVLYKEGHLWHVGTESLLEFNWTEFIKTLDERKWLIVQTIKPIEWNAFLGSLKLSAPEHVSEVITEIKEKLQWEISLYVKRMAKINIEIIAPTTSDLADSPF